MGVASLACSGTEDDSAGRTPRRHAAATLRGVPVPLPAAVVGKLGMPRRTLRPSFVVTFVLGASAIVGGCGSSESNGNPLPPSSDGGGDTSIGDGSIGDAGCPVEQPPNGTPCDLPSSSTLGPRACDYDACVAALCSNGTWELYNGCNPPAPVPDAAPDVSDAGTDVHDAGSDALDASPDGEARDGGND